MPLFIKSIVLIVTLIFGTASYGDTDTCDRTVYPEQQTLNLNNVARLAPKELCEVKEDTVRCVNKNSGKVACLKCPNSRNWIPIENTTGIYKCQPKEQ